MNRIIRSMTILLGLLVITPIAVMGQSVDELCEEFINVVFPEIGQRCSGAAASAACLAYGEVNPTFFQDGQPLQVLPELFENDQTTSLEGDEGIVQEAFDAVLFELNAENVLASEWGVAIQQVQANLPRQTGENASYVVFGGARIENDLEPELAVVLPDEPVVVGYDRVNVYSSPLGLDYIVESERLETLSGGGTLEADAISPDGAWLRVFFPYDRTFGERLDAWVGVDELTSVAGIEELPVMGPEDYTTMQKFYLENPLIEPGCEIVPPPGVMVQGPDRTEVDINVNDLPVRVTSTAFIRRVGGEPDFILEVAAVVGVVVVNPETPGELVILEGDAEYFCQTPLNDFGINTLDDDRQVTEGCDGPGFGISSLGGLDRLPPSILNYPIRLPIEVCPSGIGIAECVIEFVSEERFVELCQAGVLPSKYDELCDRLLNG